MRRENPIAVRANTQPRSAMPKSPTRSGRRVAEVKVEWDKSPPMTELAKATHRRKGILMEVTDDYTRSMRLTYAGSTTPITAPESYLLHGNLLLPQVKSLYSDAGFQTDRILQDPFGHPGPTTACTIGFLSNLPRELWDKSFSLFASKGLICRIHVDIAEQPDGQQASVPHVEPDVRQPAQHLYYAYWKHGDVRGKPAVGILKYLLNM